MRTQNYQNHRRWTPSFHFVTLPLVAIMLIGAFVNLFSAEKDDLMPAFLICLGAVIMSSLYYHTRTFGLKLQNRLVRAEENLRHFRLTGKPLNSRLRLSQIIALRFANDEQFIQLAEKAVVEKLSNAAIKQLITDWRGDYYRI